MEGISALLGQPVAGKKGQELRFLPWLVTKFSVMRSHLVSSHMRVVPSSPISRLDGTHVETRCYALGSSSLQFFLGLINNLDLCLEFQQGIRAPGYG